MKVRPRLIIAVLLLTLTVTSVIFAIYSINKKPTTKDSIKLVKLSCPDKSERCLTTQLVAIQLKYDSKTALKLISNYVVENPDQVGTCHTVVHTLGINDYLKYKDLTRVYREGSNTCSWAYLHGAIIAAYKTATLENATEITKNLCIGLASEDTTAEGECYHGVGHAVMLATNDFAKAMSVCEVILDDRGLTSCVQGAIMEYSAKFPMDPVGAASIATQTYKDCLTLTQEKTKTYCIYSVGESNLRADGRQGDVRPAWKRCQVLGEKYLQECARGLGKAAPDQLAWDPEGSAKICNGLPVKYQDDCNAIAAMTIGTVLLDEKYTIAYCGFVLSPRKEACLEVLPTVKDYVSRNKS